MNLETYYRIMKHDSEGSLIEDSGMIPSGSYVIQLLEMLQAYLIMRLSVKNATDVDNVESSIYGYSTTIPTFGKVNAGLGDDTFGIVVGTNAGATAEANENYKLDTKILHSAVGAENKLNYQAVTFIAPAVVGANVDFNISRTFLNETGATITVKEIGIICKNITNTKYHLLLRDVVSDEAVLDGYTLTVVYTLRTTV